MNIADLKDACFLEIHNNTLDELSALTDSLETDSTDKISEILLNIVIIFNNYLDNININNHNIIIKKLYELYKNNKEINKDDLTDLIKRCIIFNIRSLFSIETKCTDEIIKSNSTIIYYLTYSIYKSIIILYTYEYYFEKITEYFSRSNPYNFNSFITYLITTNDDDKSDKISEKELNKTLDEILDLDYDIKIKPNSCTYEAEITIADLTNIYNKIIKKFLKKVINSTNSTLSINDINKIGIAFITANPDQSTHKTCLITINKTNGIYHVLIIKTFLLLQKITVSNNIITIPQYIGICWYVSMLTGICYSDASRKLILSKIDDLKDKLSTGIEASETNFIKTVIYIIETITEPQLKYGDNINENCNIFKYFKNELPMFLHLKYNEITESLIRENGLNQRINDSEIAGSDDYYFINIINRILKNNDQKKNLLENIYKNDTIPIPSNMTGLTIYGFGILNMLYKMLAIDSYYFLNIESQIYKKKLDSAIINPDIIIIQKLSQYSIDNYIKSSLFEEDITDKILFTNENSETFTFNGNNYKLDYVLYANTATNNECTREGCGHCISAINYHGEKYYYNSGNAEKNFNCDVESIRIPCTLNRQDWNINNIKTPHFTINKCFYRNVDLSKNDIKIEKDIIDESQLYFDNDDIICVYVKVGKVTEGGKNTTYKSTHKKVNIMNKNKTIIERIVYIDNNKNKFIKFNKKYESLSTFKYNRKNKYYYI